MAELLTPTAAAALAAVENGPRGSVDSSLVDVYRDCDEFALLAWVDHVLRRGR
jgi:hypothetical protein